MVIIGYPLLTQPGSTMPALRDSFLMRYSQMVAMTITEAVVLVTQYAASPVRIISYSCNKV